MVTIRRLAPGDEAVLELLAREDASFDVPGRADPEGRKVLAPADARATLADAAVLFWIAEEAGEVVGFLLCHVLRMRCDDAREVLLYEIGVRQSRQRTGIGRALMAELDGWMRANDVREVWVGADNEGAVAFYRACGFEADPRAVYMARERI
jgi:GNAT superfamily N-acetyltransferase